MNYPKDIIRFVEDVISDYAKYDGDSDSYHVDIDDLPDFTRYEFAVKMMSLDDMLASEATGPDNPDYEKKMLPALTRYLMNSTDRDEEIEFCNAWREGVSAYFNNTFQELLDEYGHTKRCDEMHDAGFHQRMMPDNGEVYWSRY
jgi:hypothetical protein